MNDRKQLITPLTDNPTLWTTIPDSDAWEFTPNRPFHHLPPTDRMDEVSSAIAANLLLLRHFDRPSHPSDWFSTYHYSFDPSCQGSAEAAVTPPGTIAGRQAAVEVGRVTSLISHVMDLHREHSYSDVPLVLAPFSGVALGTVKACVPVPTTSHPDVNFRGQLIGPRGAKQKKIESESDTTVKFRGIQFEADTTSTRNMESMAIIEGKSVEGVVAAQRAIWDIMHQAMLPDDLNVTKQEELALVSQAKGLTRAPAEIDWETPIETLIEQAPWRNILRKY